MRFRARDQRELCGLDGIRRVTDQQRWRRPRGNADGASVFVARVSILKCQGTGGPALAEGFNPGEFWWPRKVVILPFVIELRWGADKRIERIMVKGDWVTSDATEAIVVGLTNRRVQRDNGEGACSALR